MKDRIVERVLINAETATSNGTWIDVRSMRRGSVHVIAPASGTIQVRASCKPTIPGSSDHDDQIGTDVQNGANEIIQFEEPIKWLKAMTSAYSSGTGYAYFVGLLTERGA